MKLSIIIPVYNEETTLKKIVKKVKAVQIYSIKKEIIIVDDGSCDRTPEILAKIHGCKKVAHKQNLGKGAAIKTALKHVSGDMIMIQDADLEYDPAQIPDLIRPILNRKTNIVYGSRFLNQRIKLTGKNRVPFPHYFLGNKFLIILTNLLYSSCITDMETCYKAFSKGILDRIEIESNRFDFEPEITAKILRAGEKILEIPIESKPRTQREGKKISWKDGICVAYILLKYRFLK